MRLEVTSWDNAVVGSGAIVNQVRLAYNTFGQPVIEYQEHGGAVNTGTSPKVQYGTAGGSGNTIRPTSITYPNGRVVVWDYSTTWSTPDALSRVARVFVDSVVVASYIYAGLGRIVQVDHPQPFIRYDLATGSGSDPYAGLDRFGRVIDCRWVDYGSGTVVRAATTSLRHPSLFLVPVQRRGSFSTVLRRFVIRWRGCCAPLLAAGA